MTALGDHIIENKDGTFRVDCTLKPIFDHYLTEERERRQEDHLHREKLYSKASDLDRRVTRLETKVVVYAVAAAALFQLTVDLLGKAF